MPQVVQLKPRRRRGVDPGDVSEVTAAVPIPAKKPAKYPIASLRVGESFSCPARVRAAMRVYIHKTRKAHPARQFTIRVEEDDETRIRVWRVK